MHPLKLRGLQQLRDAKLTGRAGEVGAQVATATATPLGNAPPNDEVVAQRLAALERQLASKASAADPPRASRKRNMLEAMLDEDEEPDARKMLKLEKMGQRILELENALAKETKDKDMLVRALSKLDNKVKAGSRRCMLS